MLNNEPSVIDLEQVSTQLKELTTKRPELENEIKSIRRQIIEMKVALSELDELRQDHDRGRLTEDTYLTRRMKLKTDYLLAREGISDIAVDNMLNAIKEPNEKSRLQKIKDKISSNKDTILFISQIGASLLKAAIRQP